MCGIYCCIRYKTKQLDCETNQIDTDILELLRNRGPNCECRVCFDGDTFHILFAGFVLWQQGSKLCRQPVVASRYSLLMNGDLFSERELVEQSDTEWLSEQIDACSTEDDLINVFRRVEGPYSIIIYDKKFEIIYFIRDSLGRQSLLLATDSEDNIYLSSVLAKSTVYSHAIEVPSLGLFALDLKSKFVTLNPWKDFCHDPESADNEWHALQTILRTNIEIRSSILPRWIHTMPSLAVDDFNLANVLVDHTQSDSETIFRRLLMEKRIESCCDHLMTALKRSVTDRINATPAICRQCLNVENGLDICHHATVGLLFSGGIDCTILACITDRLIDHNLPIDLINVSFEKIVRAKAAKPIEIDYNTPDRLSALASLDELRRLNPKRKWNLIEVNVTRDELNEMLRKRLRHLVYPLTSVLDESLAAVLWFGSNADGRLNGKAYKSSCRVLLIGSGADELFGGYTRHRNAFIRPHVLRTPYENLAYELEFDYQRLPSRNLARDDRVIGDCGVTARSPFLEEHFVQFVRSLRAHQRCYHALQPGIGDKLLLRLCGYRLGLRDVTKLKKRAMQFGSRVADSKQNAKDNADSLLS